MRKVLTCKRLRPPMFEFVFEAALLEFQYQRPAFEPLFQLPPIAYYTRLLKTIK